MQKKPYDTNKYLRKMKKYKTKTPFHIIRRDKKLSVGIQLIKRHGKYDHEENHEHDEIYYILKGEGHLKIGKKKPIPLSEGMAYFVPYKTPHTFYSGNKDLVFLFIFNGEDC